MVSQAAGQDCVEDPLVLLHMIPMVFPNMLGTTLFFDDGSTCCLITHKFAGFLGLKGVPVTQYIEVAGRDYEVYETSVYKMDLKDNTGQTHKLELIGLEKITTNPGRVNIKEVYNLFPHIEKGALDRPHQEVGILIGQDQVQLLPTGGAGRYQAGSLRVMEVKFGSGFVLGGHHSSFKGNRTCLTDEAKRVTSLKFAKRSINGKKINLISCRQYPSFLEAEELGTIVPRKCDQCSGCTRCSNQSQELTRKEQEELQMLRENLTHDEVNERVIAKYPIIGDLTKMKDNRYQAESMAKGLEKRLIKRNQLEAYNVVFNEYVEQGALIPVEKKEIEEWKSAGGVVHYISHHGVDNDHSATTPLRLVANSTVKNFSTGPSANDLWPKGPNSINNLLKVLFRWRTYEVALVMT